jgi:mRNA interferase RelE/StbE
LAWTIDYTESAKRQVSKLDRAVAQRIVNYLREHIANLDDPRDLGRALSEDRFKGLWRYRVGDYRIIARIEDQAVRVLVVSVGNRREVYRN